MMNRREELNAEMMEQVNGGIDGLIHKNCGGNILNAFNPFKYCVCDKCGEENYSFMSFDRVYDDDIEFQYQRRS